MRELKFRAWNIFEKRMLFDIAVKNSKFVYPAQTSGNDTWDAELIELNGSLIMQFTGLYDCNDNPVYEGDILEFDDTEIAGETYKGTANIFYCDDLSIINIPGWYLESFPNGQIWSNFFPFNRKIIGNIYENPELVTRPIK